MLSAEEATALVATSRLLDERWYGRLAGVQFASREEAARHWVEHGPDLDASPNPLLEPAWLFPGTRWRREAPDPLSYLLSRPTDDPVHRRNPHPLYAVDQLGPLEAWLADHDPDELLPGAPRERPPLTPTTVGVAVTDLRRAVRWVRHLARLPGVTGFLAKPGSPGALRVLRAVSGTTPNVSVPDWFIGSSLVEVGPEVEPPAWPWLPALLAALERPGVAAAQPLLLTPVLVLAAPVLAGHPVSAVERLDGVELPTTYAGVLARRAEGPAVLATGSWLVAPGPLPAQDPGTWAPLEERARRVEVVEGRPSLRWAIDVAAGAGPIGRRWGDWHFARSLGDALERLGQWVEIDHPETRGRSTRTEDDVVLTLRGLERVPPPRVAHPHLLGLLWVISHPDDVTAEELASHDVAFAAGTAWAERHGVRTLLQCTDATRFHPGVAVPDDEHTDEVLFVGNARGGARPAVVAAREAGVPVTVIGAGWEAHGVEPAADRIANTDLPARYAAAGVVLADHWPDMREQGFVSNRVFDVLAVGGRLLVDDVAGLAATLGTQVPLWRTPADLARLCAPPWAGFPDAETRLALARRVVAAHSFDARAATLLDAALERRAT